MKKYLISLLLFVTFFAMSNHISAGQDLSSYFSVTDFRFCEDVVEVGGRFICNSEKKEYTSKAEADQDEDDNKVCNSGSSDERYIFSSIIDWTFDYEDYDGTIQEGDYVSIPLFRDRYVIKDAGGNALTGYQQLLQGGSLGETDLYVNGIKIGTWNIADPANRILYIKFSDGINDSRLTKSLQGQFKTTKNFYFAITHRETSDVNITVGSGSNERIEPFCIKSTIPSTRTAYEFNYGINSTSNNFVSWRFLSNRGTFRDLCTAFNNNSEMVDTRIYDNLIFEADLGEYYSYNGRDVELGIDARIEGLYIPKLPDEYDAIGSGTTVPMLSLFTRDNNPAANYATLEDYRQGIDKLHYGLYVDSGTNNGTLVINLGEQPSRTITYGDAIRTRNLNCDRAGSWGCDNVGSYVSYSAPFTYDPLEINAYNIVYGVDNASKLGHGYSGGNVMVYQITLKQYFPTVISSHDESIAVNWYWTDSQGNSNTETEIKTATLQPASSNALTRGVLVFQLLDKDSKVAIDGTDVTLIKCSDANCTSNSGTENGTTNTNGIVTFSGLDDGYYKITQNSFKTGYTNSLETYRTYNGGAFSNKVETNIIEIAGDGVSLYGTNQRQSFTITYKPGSKGTFSEYTEDILYGNTPNPVIPTATGGWVFAGWKDSDSGDLIQTLPPVTQNKTYVAQWYKNIKVSVLYIDSETNSEISTVSRFEEIKRDGTTYDVSDKKIEIANYEFVSTEGNETGTRVDDDITVKYFYRKKRANLIDQHYDCTDESNRVLITSNTVEKIYGENYEVTETEFLRQHPNYILKTASSNNSGTVDEGTVTNEEIVIVFCYQKKDSHIVPSLNVTGKESITSSGEKVNYKINYNVEYTDYIGSSNITIVDTLPYEIDENDSNLDGGIYNNSNKTITWTFPATNINSYTNNAQSIEKNIEVKYKGTDLTKDVITNKVTAEVVANNTKIPTTKNYNTDINVVGKIKITYKDKDGNEIFESEESIDKVGKKYYLNEKTKAGYKIVESPKSKEIQYTEQDQEINYVYERIKIHIGITSNDGGTVEGEEDVYYGESSTEGKIKITASEGYIIKSVKVNGKEMEIPKEYKELTLSKFVNVTTDQNIEVEFMKESLKIDVKDTGIRKVAYILISVAFIILGLFIIKKLKIKTQI